MADLELVETSYGFKMWVNPEENVGSQIKNGDCENVVIDEIIKHCKPGDIFLDIGACIGYVSLAVAEHVSEVIAVATDPRNYDALVKNKLENECNNNVKKYQHI